MDYTKITALLIDKGFEIVDFSNTGFELDKTENGVTTMVTIREDDVTIESRDNDTREIFLDVTISFNKLNKTLLNQLLELAENLN
jgi:hypothetical protein